MDNMISINSRSELIREYIKKIVAILLVLTGIALHQRAQAEDVDINAILEQLAKEEMAQWVISPLVLKAVVEQNQANDKLTLDEIIVLDKQWRSEVKTKKYVLIQKVLDNELSIYLKGLREGSNGTFTEIFVMDNRGLNVGVSDITSDYWQGDEDKWQKTYLLGPGAMHIGDVELDDSTKKYQAQVSLPILSKKGKVIGVITAGVSY